MSPATGGRAEHTIPQFQVALVQALPFALIEFRVRAWRRTREPLPRNRSLSRADVGECSLVLLQRQYPGRRERSRNGRGLGLRAGKRGEEAPHQTAGHLCG